MHQSEAGALYLSDTASGQIAVYQPDGAGEFVFQGGTGGAAYGLARHVIGLRTLEMGGVTHVFAADCVENGVISYRADPVGGHLVEQGSMSAAKGLGIMQPVDMEVVQAYGQGYVLLASAGTSGGAISVMQVAPDGRLGPTDHVLDTLETRFGQVQSLEVISAGGRVYVLAGGG